MGAGCVKKGSVSPAPTPKTGTGTPQGEGQEEGQKGPYSSA